jgi:hypothetical protein
VLAEDLRPRRWIAETEARSVGGAEYQTGDQLEIGELGPERPERPSFLHFYFFIRVIFDPSSDTSAINPFSPNTKPRIGLWRVLLS